MIRWHRIVSAVLLVLAGVAAGAQSPGNSAPTPSVPAPRPAHADDPLPLGGTRANPADPASPPLADPLKQEAVNDPAPTLATPAVQFISQASMDGLTEIQMAQVALRQSNAPEIREFARRMAADHQSLNAKLDALAARQGTSVPRVLDADHASSVENLGQRSGRMFDAAYAAQMRLAHDRAIALYSGASSLSDREVAQFASDALPMLKSHRSQAQSLERGSPRRRN